MRHRGDAVGDADLGVGQRVVDRRDQVVDRPLELLEERRGHAVRAGRHVDRRRLQHQGGRALVHLRVDRQQRAALAVDRHLDLLVGRRSAEQEAVGVAVQVDAEDVVAVGREGVHHRDAAAGAERRAVDALQLRGGLRHAVVRLARLGVAVAQRQRRHLAGRAQVAFHQRRREGLRVGDVVEALADGVGRQQRGDVDVERQQVLDRAGVLGAVEALEAARARRRRAAPPRRRCGSRTPPPCRRARCPRAAWRRPGASSSRAACGSSSPTARDPRPPARRRSPPATARRPCRARCGRWRRYCLTVAVWAAASKGTVAGAAGARRTAGVAGAAAGSLPPQPLPARPAPGRPERSGPPERRGRPGGDLARLHGGQPRQRGGGHEHGHRDRHGPGHSFSSCRGPDPPARAARDTVRILHAGSAPRT